MGRRQAFERPQLATWIFSKKSEEACPLTVSDHGWVVDAKAASSCAGARGGRWAGTTGLGCSEALAVQNNPAVSDTSDQIFSSGITARSGGLGWESVLLM